MGYKQPGGAATSTGTSGEAFRARAQSRDCRRASRAGPPPAASPSRCTAIRMRTFRTAGSFRRRPIRIAACATACAYLRATARRRTSRSSCRRTMRCRRAGWPRSARRGLNLLGSFLSFHPSHASVGVADAAELVARPAVPRRAPGARRRDPIGLSARAALRPPRRVRLPQPDSGHDARRVSSRGFEEARAVGGDFCLATHYWEVDDRLRGMLDATCSTHAARYSDVRFVARRGALRMTTDVEWGDRAAQLYGADYARRYRATRRRAARRRPLVTRFGGWTRRAVRRLRPLDRRARSRLRHRPLLLGAAPRRPSSSASTSRRPMLDEAKRPVDAGHLDVPKVDARSTATS